MHCANTSYNSLLALCTYFFVKHNFSFFFAYMLFDVYVFTLFQFNDRFLKTNWLNHAGHANPKRFVNL